MDFRRNTAFSKRDLQAEIPIVRDAFARPVQFENPLAADLAADEREIATLTEGQFKAVVAMRQHRRCAICGGAGTGKTLLAIKEAQRLEGLGRRTALLCYNQPLADYLRERSPGVSFVGTFHELCSFGLAEALLPVPSSYEEYADAMYGALLEDKVTRFDGIVVDEGQDFAGDWWVVLEYALSEAGFLRVFFDDNQRVRPEGEIPAELPPPVYLDDNVRNTRAVHGWFKPYYRSDSDTLPAGPVGRRVERIVVASSGDLGVVLGNTLHRLVTLHRVASHDIVVLTAKGRGETALSRLRLKGTYKLVDGTPVERNEVRWETVRRFKGLEASVVVVVEIDGEILASPAADALLYVAFSRPRSHLVVLAEDAVLRDLETRCA